MASRSTNGRKPITGSEKPKKVRKRVTEIPQLDDDKIYADVLKEHFDEASSDNGNGKKNKRRRRSRIQRKWFWPKKPFETTPEREALMNEINAIYSANDFSRPEGTMPHEYMSTDVLINHLQRLKAGLTPDITKKGILSVETSNSN